MRIIYITASLVALLLTIVPSFLVLFGTISNEHNKWLMLTGFLLWFLSAPLWMGKNEKA